MLSLCNITIIDIHKMCLPCIADVILPRLVTSVKQHWDPCCGPPMDLMNYRKCISNFPSIWKANQHCLLKQANHCASSNPCTQVGIQNKDFSTVLLPDLSRGLVLSETQAKLCVTEQQEGFTCRLMGCTIYLHQITTPLSRISFIFLHNCEKYSKTKPWPFYRTIDY